MATGASRRQWDGLPASHRQEQAHHSLEGTAGLVSALQWSPTAWLLGDPGRSTGPGWLLNLRPLLRPLLCYKANLHAHRAQRHGDTHTQQCSDIKQLSSGLASPEADGPSARLWEEHEAAEDAVCLGAAVNLAALHGVKAH